MKKMETNLFKKNRFNNGSLPLEICTPLHRWWRDGLGLLIEKLN
jgi:hypothetical protein